MAPGGPPTPPAIAPAIAPTPANTPPRIARFRAFRSRLNRINVEG